MRLKPLTLAVAGLASLLISGAALAQKKYDPGASDKEIKLGHTNPYSGPLSAYGTIGKAIAAYWTMVNDKGGIRRRGIGVGCMWYGIGNTSMSNPSRKSPTSLASCSSSSRAPSSRTFPTAAPARPSTTSSPAMWT